MQLKTSTKISIKFTVFTLIILIFFGVVINLILLFSWYPTVNYELQQTAEESINPRNSSLKSFQRDDLVVTVPIFSQEAIDIRSNKLISNISLVGDDRTMYYEDGLRFNFIFINSQVSFQLSLIYNTIFLIFISSVLCYLVSIIFVKYSLRNLNSLVLFTKNLDLDNLDRAIDIDGPPDDEIRIVADTLNSALNRVNSQTLSLKDFISSVSHELKTPLMMISTDVDLALKSKKYEIGLQKVKSNVKNINELLQDLILITKLEKEAKLEKTQIDISDSIKELITNVSSLFKDKDISLNLDIKPNVVLSLNNAGFEIIIKNLVENSFKYTRHGGIINIHLNEDYFEISDTGIGISSNNLANIFDRFWQEEKSRTDNNSFGLGLFLVKKLVNMHGFKISVQSQKDVGTTFRIDFKN